MSFERAEAIARAVLYEGYLLYPYRASAVKNRFRWQFGVVAPRAYSEATGSDPWAMQTECLVEEHGTGAEIDLKVRCLRPRRPPGAAESDEAVEHDFTWLAIPLARLLDREHVETRSLPDVALPPGGNGPAAHAETAARPPLAIVVRLQAVRCAEALVRLSVRIENESTCAAGVPRDEAMRRSLVGTHTLIALRGGAFLSLIDPPDAARDAAAACRNEHTWPVLAGEPGSRDLLLSAPIILPDYPAIAPESPQDLFDGTEIDELLTLRVMTLTDAEKDEARKTDDHARSIVDRADMTSPDLLGRLHGAIRGMSGLEAGDAVPRAEGGDARLGPARPAPASEATGEWDSWFNPEGESPEDSTIRIGTAIVSRGTRVRLRPARRADAFDILLAGRLAVVQRIDRDVDGESHVAVVIESDPAAELSGQMRRFFYFRPDEIEPL